MANPPEELTLDTPIGMREDYVETIKVLQYSVHPYEEIADVWFEFGYYDVSGGWHKTKAPAGDEHVIIKNIPAVPDDPDTPEDESVPANLAYDNLAATADSKPQGVSFESLFLNMLLPKYPGTIG